MSHRGFTLVEVLLAVALFSLVVSAIVGGVIYSQQTAQNAGSRSRAALLLEEGLEAVRSMRDQTFNNLTEGDHGLAISGGNWTFLGDSDQNGIFSRTTSILSINTSTKDITISVSWPQSPGGTSTISSIIRLTNWREN